MRVAILDDDTDTLRTLPCFAKLGGHEVTIGNDHTDDVDVGEELLRCCQDLTAVVTGALP